ncbi:MAG TPA: response regulator [Thermoanaerobaculia bacterium]|jgi:DNA-binding response OmpR family regulator|nr:response regulator [Thermoanaerobaculia bacterium]
MKRILIIDDDPDIREIAMTGFEIAGGWEAREAASGLEGVKLARSNPPDVILLDVMMPEMDGPTTVALLQNDARTRNVPIIYLTAKIHLTGRERVCGFISKPFNPLTLPADVEAIMSRTARVVAQ